MAGDDTRGAAATRKRAVASRALQYHRSAGGPYTTVRIARQDRLSGIVSPTRERSLAELFRQFFYLAFLMRRPQDVRGGEATLFVGVSAGLLTYVLAAASLYGFGPALYRAVIDMTMTGIALWAALRLTGKGDRFTQAFGGYCGAVAFVNAVAIPVYGTGNAVGGDVGFADFILLVWNLSLLGHVIRHTFEVRLPIGVLAAFVYVIVLTGLLGVIAPLPQAVG